MFDDDFSCVRVSQRVFGGALEHLPNKDGDTISLPALVHHAKWLIEVWWIIMEDCFFVRYSDAPPPPAWFCGQFRRSFFFRDFRLSSNTFLLSLLLQQWIFASVFFSFSSLDVNGFIGRRVLHCRKELFGKNCLYMLNYQETPSNIHLILDLKETPGGWSCLTFIYIYSKHNLILLVFPQSLRYITVKNIPPSLLIMWHWPHDRPSGNVNGRRNFQG